MNIENLNLRDVSLFVTTADLGNLSAAGRRLGMSPATASRRMAEFEAALGVRLFYRTTRSISLTVDGAAFLGHAQRILKELHSAADLISGQEAKVHGTLRVTAPIAFGQGHIAPALPAFLTRYPDVKVDLVLSERILDVVGEGIDVAVRIAALADSGLKARKLADVERVVCASPAYLERHGTPRTPHELKMHNCIVSAGRETWSFTRGGQRHDVTVRGNLRSNDGVVVRDMALAGMGIVLRGMWDVGPHLARGELTPLLTDYRTAVGVHVWAVYPGGGRVPPKVRAFVDFLADRFGPTPYWQDGRPPPG